MFDDESGFWFNVAMIVSLFGVFLIIVIAGGFNVK